jgi:hypothetical protein
MFFSHKKCKNDKHHELIKLQVESDKKVHSLEFEIVQLLNQIQELKAINNYQTWELEKRVAELEEQLKLRVIEVNILEQEILDKKPKKGKDE